MARQADSDRDNADVISDEITAIKERALNARLEYEREQGRYHDFANDVVRLIKTCLDEHHITYHTITGREKDPDSFEKKAAKYSDGDPSVAKYSDPIQQITDKAAVRITTYFLEAVNEVLKVIEDEFEIVEPLDKKGDDPDRLGYRSVHCLVRYRSNRTSLAEYRQFTGLIAEIQVRTILQHAWAEIEHDIQYKAVAAVPAVIRRRFTALAGLIEIADREFQTIANENRDIMAQASIKIGTGQLSDVELTTNSFKQYIDKKYGRDGRMSDWSYDYTVNTLIALGFTNLGEVDECIRNYDDDALSRAIYGGRLGQLSRFDYALLAAMGEYYILAHPWTQQGDEDWYATHCLARLDILRGQGFSIGSYRPNAYPSTRLSRGDLSNLRDNVDATLIGEMPTPHDIETPSDEVE